MVRTSLYGVAAVAWVLLNQEAAQALPLSRACQAPPLPPPTGSVVSVANEPALRAAVATVASNTTIVIQPGTYNLAAGGGTLYFNTTRSNVTIRGATDSCDDVELVGAGMTTQSNTPYGIWVGPVTGITIANLTIRDIYFHPIMFDGPSGAQSPHVYNVRLKDAGEQFIKGTPAGTFPNLTNGVNNGVVEYSVMEYTTTKDPNGPGGAAYTNGVDIHHGANWIIRSNLFLNIRAASGFGLAGPAVLMWRGSSGTVVEGNLILNCQQGIALGYTTDLTPDHTGGIIRNNIVHRASSQSGDFGLNVGNSSNTKVLHNTVMLSGTYPNAIEYRFAGTTGARIQYNLLDGAIAARDGASGTVVNNLLSAPAGWFVNPTIGDLRLTALATLAIDQAAPSTDVLLDYDGSPRPIGPASDIGASELGGGLATIPASPSNLRVQ